MKLRTVRILLAAALVLALYLSGCTGAQPSPTLTPPSPTVTPPSPSVTPPSPTVTPPVSPPPTITPPSITPPPFNITTAQYVVLAWNDLGMHCLNPTYDAAVVLPPYNTVWAQVVKRGNPPQIITAGLRVEYRIINNTYSYGKRSYGQFWDNAQKLFGINLEKNTGLNLSDPNIHNGLSGTMVAKQDHFEVDGIPLTPVFDSGEWNPFQIIEITVKNSSGSILAQTDATAPVSDEMDCAKCHGTTNTFQNILQSHDKNSGTNLVNQAPVLCASCHGDPALGKPEAGPFRYLSDQIHGFHADLTQPPACYDCHPGAVTRCARSLAHTSADGNCITCHGTLSQVSSSIESGRIPWVNEPGCVTCHGGVAQVDTGSTLYRNATGHGGIYCASCHSSPHAMMPTNVPSDNIQALQYQGKAKSISSCGACHPNSRGDREISEFAEEHGGSNPERPTACNICHTAVPTNTAQWPHAFQWKAR